MKEPRWLLEQTIVAIHSVVLEEHGGAPGIRDEDMLSSALNRPKDKYSYDKDCNIYELAAAYSFGIAKNHPFVDGNKRVAFLAGTLFLELNGYSFMADESDAAFVFERLAEGKIREASLATWFEKNV
jgi:death-on-curing protein